MPSYKKYSFLAFFLFSLFFIGTYFKVHYSPFVLDIDRYIFYFFETYRSHFYTTIFFFATLFGKASIVGSIAFALSLTFFLYGKRFEIAGFVTSIFITTGLVTFFKFGIQLTRPITRMYDETGYSYPSFHAAISIALYGYIIFILLQYIKRAFLGIVFLLFSLSGIILIGMSRIYLEVHYPSDVLGGYFLGGVGLCFGISIFGALKEEYSRRKFKKTKSRDFLLTIILFTLFISFIFYTLYHPQELQFIFN